MKVIFYPLADLGHAVEFDQGGVDYLMTRPIDRDNFDTYEVVALERDETVTWIVTVQVVAGEPDEFIRTRGGEPNEATKGFVDEAVALLKAATQAFVDEIEEEERNVDDEPRDPWASFTEAERNPTINDPPKMPW